MEKNEVIILLHYIVHVCIIQEIFPNIYLHREALLKNTYIFFFNFNKSFPKKTSLDHSILFHMFKLFNISVKLHYTYRFVVQSL